MSSAGRVSGSAGSVGWLGRVSFSEGYDETATNNLVVAFSLKPEDLLSNVIAALDAGADPNALNEEGIPVLFLAARSCNLYVVDRILQESVDPHTVMICPEGGCQDIFTYLLAVFQSEAVSAGAGSSSSLSKEQIILLVELLNVLYRHTYDFNKLIARPSSGFPIPSAMTTFEAFLLFAVQQSGSLEVFDPLFRAFTNNGSSLYSHNLNYLSHVPTSSVEPAVKVVFDRINTVLESLRHPTPLGCVSQIVDFFIERLARTSHNTPIREALIKKQKEIDRFSSLSTRDPVHFIHEAREQLLLILERAKPDELHALKPEFLRKFPDSSFTTLIDLALINQQLSEVLLLEGDEKSYGLYIIQFAFIHLKEPEKAKDVARFTSAAISLTNIASVYLIENSVDDALATTLHLRQCKGPEIRGYLSFQIKRIMLHYIAIEDPKAAERLLGSIPVTEDRELARAILRISEIIKESPGDLLPLSTPTTPKMNSRDQILHHIRQVIDSLNRLLPESLPDPERAKILEDYKTSLLLEAVINYVEAGFSFSASDLAWRCGMDSYEYAFGLAYMYAWERNYETALVYIKRPDDPAFDPTFLYDLVEMLIFKKQVATAFGLVEAVTTQNRDREKLLIIMALSSYKHYGTAFDLAKTLEASWARRLGFLMSNLSTAVPMPLD